jgi:CheY-like chemotaxis protein
VGDAGSALAVSNAADAFTAAPDAAIVVTELRLHGPTDGVDLILHLHSDERTKNIPMIVLTTSAWPPLRERCLQAGADAFLAKPYVRRGHRATSPVEVRQPEWLDKL